MDPESRLRQSYAWALNRHSQPIRAISRSRSLNEDRVLRNCSMASKARSWCIDAPGRPWKSSVVKLPSARHTQEDISRFSSFDSGTSKTCLISTYEVDPAHLRAVVAIKCSTFSSVRPLRTGLLRILSSSSSVPCRPGIMRPGGRTCRPRSWWSEPLVTWVQPSVPSI